MRAGLAFLILLVPMGARAEAPFVAPADAVATAVKATETIDPKVVPGQTIVAAWISERKPAVNAQAVRDALAKTTLKVVEDRSGKNDLVVTLAAPSGARVTIALGNHQGSILVTPKPTATKPPGACVKVPDVRHEIYLTSSAIDQEGEFRQGTAHWDLRTARLLDVDGDGLLDAFVPIAPKKNSCPEDVSYRVYVMRGACGHDLGVVGPGSFHYSAPTVPLDASGFRPLTYESETTAYGKGPIPEMQTSTRAFAVTKGRYARTKETRTSGKCHHCARWSCNPVTPYDRGARWSFRTAPSAPISRALAY